MGGEDTDEEIINMSSHQDALAASLTLLWYVANLDDPCAWKLEAILAGLWPSSMPAGSMRHETNFKNILFRLKLLIIIVFTQYMVI